LYALAYINSGPLLLSGILGFSYDGYIKSRMLQITRIRKSHRISRYDRSYTKRTHTKNPGRMPGFFIA
jgi:hypothetical protein